MITPNLEKKCGLTLVELLAAMAASAIVLLTIGSVLTVIYNGWHTNNAYVRLRRNAAFAFDIMSRDIHESLLGDISFPAANNMHLKPNSVRTTDSDFWEDTVNQTLECTRRGGAAFTLASGVSGFGAVKTSEGVEITLIITDDRYNITLTNNTYVFPREMP